MAMNRKSAPNVSVRKTLVRNTKQPLPITLRYFDQNEHECEIVPEVIWKQKLGNYHTPPPTAATSSTDNQLDFSVPTLNSTKYLIGDIVRLAHGRGVPLTDSVPRLSRKSSNSTMTKKMNFAPSEAVFKDLMPLGSKCSNTQESTHRFHRTSSKHLTKKDSHPELDRVRTARDGSVEFLFIRHIPLRLEKIKRDYDGLKTYSDILSLQGELTEYTD